MEKKKSKLLKILSFFSIMFSFLSLTLFLIYGIKLLKKGNISFGWIAIICAIIFIAIEIFLVFLDKADNKSNKKKKKIFKIVFKYSTSILKIVVILFSIIEAFKNNTFDIEGDDVAWLGWIQITLFVDIVLRINILIVKLSYRAIKKKIKKPKNEEEDSYAV